MWRTRRKLFNILFLVIEIFLLGLGTWLVVKGIDKASSVLSGIGIVHIITSFVFWGLWFQVRRAEQALSKALSTDVDFIFGRGSLDLSEYLEKVKRKEALLMPHVIEGKIGTREELSRALERIVSIAFKITNAESAELALFDKSASQYHSSIVIGRPFRESIDESLISQKSSILTHLEPISFAGTVLGALRISHPRGKTLTEEQRTALRFLALQSSIALANSDFVSALLKMKQLSEDSVKAKTGFLANLSHELRGPLGIILNGAELMLDGLCGTTSEEQNEILRMIGSNGAHLLDLLSDVLDYAKVESGNVNPQKVTTSVADLLVDIVNVVRAQADKKGHSIEVRDTEMLTVLCDKRHLRQMLINILTNAIKYTPDGGKIVVSAERNPGKKIKILVTDNGIGMSEDDRPKVFGAFERIEHTYASRQVGTGLGMPLTKKLAELNGGTVDFTSAPGKGSEFWIILPAGSENNEIIEESHSQVEIDGHGASILIVARQDAECGLTVRYLSEKNFKVHVGATVEEVSSAIARDNFSLIIIDDNTESEFNGEPASAIRNLLESKPIPILFVSSKAFIFDVEKQLRLGVDRHVSKPLSLRDLGALAQELIHDESRLQKKGTVILSEPRAKPPTIH